MDVTDTFWKKNIGHGQTANDRSHVQRQHLTWKRAGFGRAKLGHPAVAAAPTIYESAFHDGKVRG